MENDFFDEDAMVYPIVRQDIPEKELLISAAELQQAMQQKVHEDRRVPQTIVKKKVTDSSILEVDLHITELLDNTNGLSNADMLKCSPNMPPTKDRKSSSSTVKVTGYCAKQSRKN